MRFGDEVDHLVPELGPQRGEPALERLVVTGQILPAALAELALLAVGVHHLEVLELVAEQELLELGLALDPNLALAVLQLVERRLGDVDVAGLDQLRHLPVEEGEHQRSDVRAVDVRVRHQDHLVVARLPEVELVVDAGPDRGDQRLDLVVGQDLVDPALLDVDDLAAQRQDRLGVPVAALLRGAAGRVALDDEELGVRRILDRAVGELAGQRRVLERRLPPGQVSGLAGRVAGPGRVDGLDQDPAGVGGVLLEELTEGAVDDFLDQALDRRVAELGLRLPLELRIGEFHRDHRGQTLANVLAGEVLVLLLEQAAVPRDRVQGPGQGGAEAGEMGPALVCVDVVGKAEDGLLIGAVPLHRDLDLALLGLSLEEGDLAVQRVLGLVQVPDEVRDAALVLELDLLPRTALIDQLDLQTTGEEGGLAETLGERLEVELDLLAEDLHVGEEGDRRPAALHGPALLELGDGLAALIGLLPDAALSPDLQLELLGERVDYRDADAVQSARDLVSTAVAELAAGVQRGQNDLRGGLALLLHPIHGDPAAVVRHGDAVVRVEGDRDLLGVARDRLVHGVVHNLVDEMVEAAGAGGADVHAGSLADGLEALEDGDVLRAIRPASLALGAIRSPGLAGRALLLAGCSALGGIRHSASFQSNQGMPTTFVTRLGKSLRTRGSRPHSSRHKSTSREPRKLRQTRKKPLQTAN